MGPGTGHVTTVRAAAEIAVDLPEGFKITELGPLPDEWEVRPLSHLADY